MAKRKKRSGGGSFGGTQPGPRRLNDVNDPSRDPGGVSEHTMKLLQKAIISQGLMTDKELEKFLLERFVDRPLDELAEELDGERPKTPLDQAEDLMDGIFEEQADADVRRIAEQALELSAYCVSAWLALSQLADSPSEALELIDQGIEKGRVRFDGLIEALEPGQDIWGWVEARDFMRLLYERAIALEQIEEMDDAIEAYQELLTLNPGDNLGARDDLLFLLMVFHRLEDARALLRRYPNDTAPAFAYGRALFAFAETMELHAFEMPDMEAPGAPKSPPAFMKRLGPEFDHAKKLMNRAVKTNPFVPWMMTHPQLMGVELPEMVEIGGPYEAVIYSQRWSLIWYAAVLPFFAMTAGMRSNPLRGMKSKWIHEEFEDVQEQFESLDEVPWWEEFENGDS